jgi:hypothetical protein
MNPTAGQSIFRELAPEGELMSAVMGGFVIIFGAAHGLALMAVATMGFSR